MRKSITIFSLGLITATPFVKAKPPKETHPPAVQSNSPTPKPNEPHASAPIYTLSGDPDPTFEQLLSTHQVVSSTGMPELSKSKPIQGTKVNVNHKVLENGLERVSNPEEIEKLKITTAVGEMSAKEAAKQYTRWYQVDGSTQIFRMFSGDKIASLTMACRIECHTVCYPLRNRVIVWEGSYCVPDPGPGAIAFQLWIEGAKVNGQGYPFLSMRAGSEYIISHRYDFQKPWTGKKSDRLVTDGTGKQIPMRFRYDGFYYEFATKTADGKYEVVSGGTLPAQDKKVGFRWGAYIGHNENGVTGNKLVLVTGAKVYFEDGSVNPPAWVPADRLSKRN